LTQINFVADYPREKLSFYTKNGHFAFSATYVGAQGQLTLFILGSLESVIGALPISDFARCYIRGGATNNIENWWFEGTRSVLLKISITRGRRRPPTFFLSENLSDGMTFFQWRSAVKTE